nr:hypothetical protein B0A51_12845 [Rachicladosporium sp. CCFEE 5018]
MTLRRAASLPPQEDIRVFRQEPLTSRAKPSKQKSQTSLLIEYFEAGKTGDRQNIKPSVRVKVKPDMRKGAHGYDGVQIDRIGKDRKPTYTRRIVLGDRTADRAAEEDADPSHLRKDQPLLPTIPPSLSTVHEAPRVDTAPRQAYVESVAESTLGAAKSGVFPSPDDPVIDDLKWLPAWAAESPSQSIPRSEVVATAATAGQDSSVHHFVSHKVNGDDDLDVVVGTGDAPGEATSCMATLGLDARKLASGKKRRVRFRPEVELAAERRQERTSPPRSRCECKLDGDRTVTEPEHSMPTSNARDRSVRQDLMTQKVRGKLTQNSAKTRQSIMIRRNGEHRLKMSSKLHGLDGDAVRDAGSAPLHSRPVAIQLAHRPATSQRQPTINNPDLLEMVELTIKRMILPDLCSNKLNQKVENSAVVDITDHDISVGGELVEMVVEGERPAARRRQEAEINEAVSHLDYRNVHLSPEQRNAGYNCFERLTVTGNSAPSAPTTKQKGSDLLPSRNSKLLSVSTASLDSPILRNMPRTGSLFSFSDKKAFIVHYMSKDRASVTLFQTDHKPPDRGAEIDPVDEIKRTRRLYEDWDVQFVRLLEHVDPASMESWQLHMMPLDFDWTVNPRCIVIGDAASLRSPFGGEGVNLALQDAFELSRILIAAAKAPANKRQQMLAQEVSKFQRTMLDRGHLAQKLAKDMQAAMMDSSTAPRGTVADWVMLRARYEFSFKSKWWRMMLPILDIGVHACYAGVRLLR